VDRIGKGYETNNNNNDNNNNNNNNNNEQVQIYVFRVFTTCSLVGEYQRFGRARHFHLQGKKYMANMRSYL
jgi:hypothetical protein